MGGIIRSVCKCGYDTKDLFVGCGMVGPEYVYVLSHCKKCKEISVINDMKPPPHNCKNCKENISVIDLPDDVGYEVLSIPCPKCEEHYLKFQETGLWD